MLRFGAGLEDAQGVSRELVVAFVVFVIVEMQLPTIGGIGFVDFPLHEAEHLFLERGELAVHFECGLVRLSDGLEPEKLPLGQALRFFDGRERVAGELRFAAGATAEEFTVGALQHGRISQTRGAMNVRS
jgi:hypothetical protein